MSVEGLLLLHCDTYGGSVQLLSDQEHSQTDIQQLLELSCENKLCANLKNIFPLITTLENQLGHFVQSAYLSFYLPVIIQLVRSLTINI